MYDCVICRYHESATKGNNRNMFEKCLVDNIRHALREAAVPCRVRRVRGRVWIVPEGAASVPAAALAGIAERLKTVFGLESFSPARLLPVDMDAIRAAGLRIPEDISIAGVDGVPILQMCKPRLTTVRQDTEAIGIGAARKLIHLIEAPDTTFPEILSVPCSLLEGETVGPQH